MEDKDIIRDTIISFFEEIGNQWKVDVHENEHSVYYSCTEIMCPFKWEGIYNKESRKMDIAWVVNRSFAPGNKTDIYYIWTTSMGVILKALLGKSVYVQYIEHPVMDDELARAVLFFPFEEIQSGEKIEEFVLRQLTLFSMSLYINGSVFGSYGYEPVKVDELAGENFSRLFEVDEQICRENHSFYQNIKDQVVMVEFDNTEYHSSIFFDLFRFEVFRGVDEHILVQKKEGTQVYNTIPPQHYEKMEYIIQTGQLEEYRIVCQENSLYILEKNRIWVLHGDFGSYKVPLEREKIMDRRKAEDAFIGQNLKIEWKYPIDACRFENLIADLLEEEPLVSKVRLLGKTNNADGGRDILIYKKRYTEKGYLQEYLQIGQCKAYEKSVSKSKVIDIRDTIERYEAEGFLLAVSSWITGNLIDHLCVLKSRYDVDWWTDREIFSRLRRNQRILCEYSDIVMARRI